MLLLNNPASAQNIKARRGIAIAKPDLKRLCPVVVVTSKYAERLQCFAEAHIITENTMQLIASKECQPVHSILHHDISNSTWSTEFKSAITTTFTLGETRCNVKQNIKFHIMHQYQRNDNH